MTERGVGDEDRSDDYGNGLPLVRDLGTLIESLAVAESEMRFQVRRLEQHVRPRTAEEEKYHSDLKEGYRTGARYAAILRRYHEGRLAGGGRNTPYRDTEQPSGIDDRGVVGAFTDE
jgi:hypothetical protein